MEFVRHRLGRRQGERQLRQERETEDIKTWTKIQAQDLNAIGITTYEMLKSTKEVSWSWVGSHGASTTLRSLRLPRVQLTYLSEILLLLNPHTLVLHVTAHIPLQLYQLLTFPTVLHSHHAYRQEAEDQAWHAVKRIQRTVGPWG